MDVGEAADSLSRYTAIENLQTAWEDKLSKLVFALYHDAIRDGLAKLLKCYSRFDKKPSFILALFLHPYFKLHYIQIVWGGAEEQRAEFAKGNHNVKNWVDEAWIIVENAMEKYWSTRPTRVTMPPVSGSVTVDEDSFTSEYDRHHRTLLLSQTFEDDWQAELHCYLKSVPADVNAETDIVQWWSASSVPCEQVFLSAKLTATDRRARLGAKVFEQLQILKHVWRPELVDHACVNPEEVDQAELWEFEDFLVADNELRDWDNGWDN
ncbi:hypothetical protein DXG01_003622 [Tephrocybe rancida]|nr:hypothetical protein DXG01_003622 [Tephrocybe rancida]